MDEDKKLESQRFIECVEKINEGKWYHVTDDIKGDVNLQYVLLNHSFDEFTQFAKHHVDKLDDLLIDKVIKLYGDCSQSNWIYYYMIRILHLVLIPASNIKRFDSSYYDEQFFKKAYEANPEVVNFVPTRYRKIYYSKGIFSKVARAAIVQYKLFKAAIGK